MQNHTQTHMSRRRSRVRATGCDCRVLHVTERRVLRHRALLRYFHHQSTRYGLGFVFRVEFNLHVRVCGRACDANEALVLATLDADRLPAQRVFEQRHHGGLESAVHTYKHM